MEEALHDGHRQRLKNRFLSEGLENFQSHEILELLLFFGIPRCDTNEIGHRLMDRFGGLAETMDAPFEELLRVKGMSKSAAVLLKLIPQAAGAYLMDKHTGQEELRSSSDFGRYFIDRFVGATEEMVYLLCLDSSLNVVCCELLAHGTVTRANVPVRNVSACLMRHNASRAVLAHNHPRGLANPSSEDVVMTKYMRTALGYLDSELVDHIVVSGKEYCSIREFYPELFEN